MVGKFCFSFRLHPKICWEIFIASFIIFIYSIVLNLIFDDLCIRCDKRIISKSNWEFRFNVYNGIRIDSIYLLLKRHIGVELKLFFECNEIASIDWLVESNRKIYAIRYYYLYHFSRILAVIHIYFSFIWEYNLWLKNSIDPIKLPFKSNIIKCFWSGRNDSLVFL